VAVTHAELVPQAHVAHLVAQAHHRHHRHPHPRFILLGAVLACWASSSTINTCSLSITRQSSTISCTWSSPRRSTEAQINSRASTIR
jgi:hypothetical protein